jgi:ABC-type oligopeptide transport system ATPase subunit
MNENVLLSARNVTKSFSMGGKKRHIAVNNLSLDMMRGETLSLVGESGCGKSTLARLIMGLARPDQGQIIFDGTDITALSESKLRPYRRRMQMVFQDPASSLDPRMKVRDIIAEPLRSWHICKDSHEIDQRILELLDMVELKESAISKSPHEFSGGQKQRIGIARALIMNPKLLICDEPISALDVSIRAQIINLLNELKKNLNLSIIFIAHDLSVVKYFCDHIVVMYFGKVVEKAPSDELFKNPLHPYTRSLLSAIPKPNPRSERKRKRITYDPKASHDYSAEQPELREIKPDHFVLCNQAEYDQYLKELKD